MELNYSQYYEGPGNDYNFGGGLVTTNDLPKQLSDKNVHFVASANTTEGTDFPLRDVNEQAESWLDATADNSQHFSYLAQQFAMQLRAAHPNVRRYYSDRMGWYADSKPCEGWLHLREPYRTIRGFHCGGRAVVPGVQ